METVIQMLSSVSCEEYFDGEDDPNSIPCGDPLDCVGCGLCGERVE